MNKSKILVFTVFNNESHVGCSYNELSKVTMPTYAEYCKIHGYDFLIRNDDSVLPGRLIGWSRFETFLKNIDKYDYQLYVECDSMLMNQTVRIENLIDDNYDIVVAKTSRKEILELNTGTTLIKCSEWNKKFFTEMFNNQLYKNSQMVDQQMFNDRINNESEVRKHCKIVSLRYFNSQMHDWFPDDNFQPGDFICHAAGSSNDYRLKLFTFLKDYIVKMPQYKIPYKPFLNIGDENVKI